MTSSINPGKDDAIQEGEAGLWLDMVEHILTECLVHVRLPRKPKFVVGAKRRVVVSAFSRAVREMRDVPRKADVVKIERAADGGVVVVLSETDLSLPKRPYGPCICGPCKRDREQEVERKRQRDERRALYSKRAVPKDAKAQIVSFVAAGEDLADVGALFGYDAMAVWKIARSAGVKVPRPVIAVRQEHPDVGLVDGLDVKRELEIACMLETGADAAFVATRLGVEAGVVEAVARAWASPEAASEPDADADWSYVPWTSEEAAALPVRDPTKDGEITFLDGGPSGWRVELAPSQAESLGDAFDDLRRQTIRGSRKTEFDVLKESVRRLAVGELAVGQNERRLKSFSHGGVMLHEFKGWQARAFCAFTTSRYPGQEVRRCALLTCFVKKDDATPDAEAERAITARAAWLAWREERDRMIVAFMRRAEAS